MPLIPQGEADIFTADSHAARFLSRQLLAYIGNKRQLLPFLAGVFRELDSRSGVRTFLDPFAGTGAVSRLAKALGYGVRANDWEFYSRIMNSCFLEIDRRDLRDLFSEWGGIEAVFAALNGDRGEPGSPYISRYYAPRDTHANDYRSERLFYTRENARKIDRIREKIEIWYPGWDLEERKLREKQVLLASLLFEASVHANTSGVFKAYHKGFGGHGKDALKRILSPIELEIPELIDAEIPSRVSGLDAAEFCRRNAGDLCYLDPPYTIHQYGSNYFMLNTIALWDKPSVSLEHREDGRLREKAGIRKDWKSTKSAFCYRRTAPDAFRELLDSIDSKFIALSYNTEGIVPIEELLEILSAYGRVEIFTQDYTVYRGGRQSITRKVSTMEFLLVVTRSERPGKAGLEDIRRKLREKDAAALLKHSFNPARIKERFVLASANGTIRWQHGGTELLLETERLYRIPSVPPALETLPDDSLEVFCEALEYASCRNRKEECEVLVEILSGELPARERKLYQKRLLTILRKFAFRKYRDTFTAMCEDIAVRVKSEPEKFAGMQSGLEELERLAELRFNG